MRHRKNGQGFWDTQQQDTVITLYPQHSADPSARQAALSGGGPLSDYSTVFSDIAALPRLNRFERWAANINNNYGRPVAKGLVKAINFIADHPIEISMGIWSILLLTHVFHQWGVKQNKDAGGTGDGPNVFVNATQDAFLMLGVGTIVFLGIAYMLRIARGQKHPNYSPFKNYLSEIEKNITVSEDKDVEEMRMITHPDRHKSDECEKFASWHEGFIAWLAKGADQSSVGEHEVEGIWEAIGYMLRDVRERFPFNFMDEYEMVQPESVELFDSDDEQESKKAELEVSQLMGEDERTMRRVVASGKGSYPGMHQEKDQVDYERSGYVMLPVHFKDPEEKEVSPQRRAKTVWPPKVRRLKASDLYNTPLLAHVETPASDEFLSPTIPELQRDSFLTASPEEKRVAAKQEWRDMQLHPQKKATNSEDLAMRLTSYVANSRIHRTGVLEKEGEREQSVKILHGLLNGLLSDPLKADKPDPGRNNFMHELAYKSFQLVNLLRPAIQDGQWGNWRYFYANCPVATEAFKRLSPQKQAWMIFTLMSGNDHGKLLALSILQDPRLALTRFGSADDRSKMTLARDVYNNSCLAAFFKAYLNEFGGMSEERAREIYFELTGVHPDPGQLAQFRIDMVSRMRLQLLWLTENSTGRMKALFENDVTAAVKILHNFTVDLEHVKPEDIQRTYAVSPEKPPVGQPKQMQYDDRLESAPHNYFVQPAKHDGSFGFSALSAALGKPVSRQDVVDKLLPMVSMKEGMFVVSGRKDPMTLQACIGREIMELLTNPALRHLVPKPFVPTKANKHNKLTDGLRMLDSLQIMGKKIVTIRQRLLEHVPEHVREVLAKDDQLLVQYYTDGSNELIDVRSRETAEFLVQTAQQLPDLIEQREEMEPQIREAFQKFCQRPEVIEAYLKYGVGFHLPLGSQTAALFAVLSGYQVELYEQNQFVEGTLALAAVHEHKEHQVLRLLCGDSCADWAELKKAVQVQPEPPKASMSQGLTSVPAFGSVQQQGLVSVPVFGSVQQPHLISAPAFGNTQQRGSISVPIFGVPRPRVVHPMGLRAISLFWSISSWSQQVKIMQEMEYGHPDKGTKGHRGSSDVLFEMDAPEKIAAVKEGVLHSGNLEALLSKLIDRNARDRAFGLLAELLSDSVHGIDYQRAFQKLVHKHYDQLSSDEQITGFLMWLENNAPDTVNPDVVRARYAAVMLTEAESQYHLDVTPRTNRLVTMCDHFYPDDDLLTAMHRMHTAFPSEGEWKARGRIFSLLLQARLTDDIDLLRDDGFQFLSANGITDLLPQIVDGFSGDITTDPRIRAKVVSWGDLIGGVIFEACPAHQEYIGRIADRFCQAISDFSVTEDQAVNLALVLMDALDTVQFAKGEDAMIKYEKMYLIYDALAQRMRHNIVTFNPDFDVLDRKLELLGAVRQKHYGSGAQKEKVHACFEGFSLRLAGYLLRRAQEGSQTADADREIARAMIDKVVNNPNSFQRISHLDRLHLGKSLGSIINRDYYLSRHAEDPTVIDHKTMAHRILYIFFSDVRHLNMSKYTSGIILFCESAGNDSPGAGIAALIAGIRGDRFLQDNFADEIDPALLRMTASLIYALYKAVPESQHFRLCGQTTEEQKLDRLNQINKIKGVLERAGLVADASNSNLIHNIFAKGALLYNAFDELGLKDFASTIRDEIKRQNSENRTDHTTDYLGSSTRGGYVQLIESGQKGGPPPTDRDKLVEVKSFGSNYGSTFV